MALQTLTSQKCQPCQDMQSPLPASQASDYLKQLPGWCFANNKKGISKAFRMKDFMAALQLMNKIAEVAEQEDHHPDLHLTGYRHLRIDLSTHALGGLSINDFILAAKIEELPKELKA